MKLHEIYEQLDLVNRVYWDCTPPAFINLCEHAKDFKKTLKAIKALRQERLRSLDHESLQLSQKATNFVKQALGDEIMQHAQVVAIWKPDKRLLIAVTNDTSYNTIAEFRA